MRLGFVVKSLVKPALKSHDSRRWQNSPHLSVSLAYLRDMFGYLATARIPMYRMATDLAPYATHPGLPQFHAQVEACAAELAEIGARAQALNLRLSFHTGPHVVLNSPNAAVAAASVAELGVLAALLDGMKLGHEAVIVTHLGGEYGDHVAARARYVAAATALPEAIRRRLALENDDVRFGVTDTLWVHERCGIPLVFDNLHHRLCNPDGRTAREALAACLATWPSPVRPKTHFSSPRTEWRQEPQGTDAPPALQHTRWSYHSDYVHPFEFIDFIRAAEGLPRFDVMLEARAKDLALDQLRRDLARFAPDLAARLESGPPAANANATTQQMTTGEDQLPNRSDLR